MSYLELERCESHSQMLTKVKFWYDVVFFAVMMLL